jgi:hypothetical protein
MNYRKTVKYVTSFVAGCLLTGIFMYAAAERRADRIGECANSAECCKEIPEEQSCCATEEPKPE